MYNMIMYNMISPIYETYTDHPSTPQMMIYQFKHHATYQQHTKALLHAACRKCSVVMSTCTYLPCPTTYHTVLYIGTLHMISAVPALNIVHVASSRAKTLVYFDTRQQVFQSMVISLLTRVYYGKISAYTEDITCTEGCISVFSTQVCQMGGTLAGPLNLTGIHVRCVG